MQPIVSIAFWLSLAALFATKTADVGSTVQHVGPDAESNPLARTWFARFGLKGGLVCVCAVYTVLALGQYALAWWMCGSVDRARNTIAGFVIAWAQWDVARFNATGRHSRFTMMILRGYAAWARWGRRHR